MKLCLHKSYFEDEIGIIKVSAGALPSMNFIQKSDFGLEQSYRANVGRTAIRLSGAGVAAKPCPEEGLVQQEECVQQPLPRPGCLGS